MLDRRRSMRFDTELAASYEDSSSSSGGETEIRNLSRGGISLAADRQLNIGDDVGLFMTIPGEGSPIRARATVTWNKKNESRRGHDAFLAGLKFSIIDNYDRARLLEYVYAQWLKTIGNTGPKKTAAFARTE